MEFVIIRGLNIAYSLFNPNALNTIFFVHGNSASSKTWYKQLSNSKFGNLRLIAFDLPAHGESSASINPEEDYSFWSLGSIMAQAVSVLSNNHPFILVGLSFGTNLVAEMLNYIKPFGIVLAGSCVFGSGYPPEKVYFSNENTSGLLLDNPDDRLINLLMNQLYPFQTIEDEQLIRRNFMKVKPPFRSAIYKSAINGKISDEIELIFKVDLPILIIMGTEDKIIDPSYLDDAPFKLWKNKVFKLENAGHFVQLDQSVAFNNLLYHYFKEILDN